MNVGSGISGGEKSNSAAIVETPFSPSALRKTGFYREEKRVIIYIVCSGVTFQQQKITGYLTGFSEDNLWISSQYTGTDTDPNTKREMKFAFFWMLVFFFTCLRKQPSNMSFSTFAGEGKTSKI